MRTIAPIALFLLVAPIVIIGTEGATAAQSLSPAPLILPGPLPAGTPQGGAVGKTPARRLPNIILPPGEILVGIVDERYLTGAQMDQRVTRMLSLPERQLSNKRRTKDELRLRLEDMVLYEWAKAAVVAAQAEDEGFTASQAEVDDALQKIYAAEQGEPGGKEPSRLTTSITAFGISREELVEYVRDAILEDKLIHAYMAKSYSDNDMRRVYENSRQLFVNPPSRRLNFMCKRVEESSSLSMRRELKKEMDSWRDKAAKAAKIGKTPVDKSVNFLEVAKKFSHPELGDIGGDFGWTTPQGLPGDKKATAASAKKGSASIQPNATFVQEVFSLEAGEVSEVLSSEFGFYVFQMVDKRQESGLNYDSAKPGVETFIYDKFKEALVPQLLALHNVYINARGLDLDELRSPKSPAQVIAEREKRSKEHFMKIRGNQLADEPEEDSTAGRKVNPFEISEKSLGILRNAAAKNPQQLATPTPTGAKPATKLITVP